MKIVIKSTNNKYQESISFENLDNVHDTIKKYSSIKEPFEAKIFAINESVSSNKLLKLKNYFGEINIFSISLYSNNRDTLIAGTSLKINSTFVNEREVKNILFLLETKKREDILHSGTVRSGDRISSNGNLCIIGDVNPGAIVSAKKNIYVWGKLLGIAFAGKGGDKNASISALYINPLQLRIANLIAIGPKDKPKNHYPEIALVEKQTINIKPFLIEIKN